MPKFKSKFEEVVYTDLVKRKVNVSYESTKLAYTVSKVYKPDLTFASANFIVELKGYHPNLHLSLADKVAFKKCYPDIDLRFCFEKDIKIRKKMTITQWADKHGFKWCIGRIPDEWFNEEPTK